MRCKFFISQVTSFSVLICCRRHYCYYKWGQHWRVISSTYSWSDKRINQQPEVSHSDDILVKPWCSKARHTKQHYTNFFGLKVKVFVIMCINVWFQDGDCMRERGEANWAGEEDELTQGVFFFLNPAHVCCSHTVDLWLWLCGLSMPTTHPAAN